MIATRTAHIKSATCIAALLILIFSAVVDAVPISTEDGLQFSQYNLTFADAEQSNSAYGLAAIDFSAITAKTGYSQGFVNIYTSAGWVVQNMPVDSSTSFPGLGTVFNLGVAHGTHVSQLDVFADFSPSPLSSFSGTTLTSFVVNELDYNAQGRNAPFSVVPAGPITPTIDWINGGLTNPKISEFITKKIIYYRLALVVVMSNKAAKILHITIL